MRPNQKTKHTIDLLFPIVLFVIFTLSAVVVILLATRIYESTTSSSSLNSVSRTALTYISEKIHANDHLTSIDIESFDGVDAIALHHVGEKEGYTTYIYFHDGSLKELFIKDSVPPTTALGDSIAKLSEFSIKQLNSSLFLLSCVDQNGNTTSTVVGIHSTVER